MTPGRFTGIGAWSGLFLVFCMPVSLLPQEKESPETARKEIQSLVDAGDWKGAGKAIKAYRKAYGKSDEGKRDVRQLERLLDGSEKIERVMDVYRKKGRHRTTATRLDQIIMKYGSVKEVVDKARELKDAVRSEYVLSIEDFEDWKTFEKSKEGVVIVKKSSAGKDVKILRDPKFVKHGKCALEWKPGEEWSGFTAKCDQRNLSEYAFLSLWICNRNERSKAGQIRIEPRSGDMDYFSYLVTIYWQGWKEVRIPLTGRSSPFSRIGNPDWADIMEISFSHSEDHRVEVHVVVDDICVEKPSR